MPLDLSRYDLDYAELHQVVLPHSNSTLSLRLMCPRVNWYWREKWNAFKRCFGRTNPSFTGAMLALTTADVGKVRGNLAAAITGGRARLPLELDAVEVTVTESKAQALRIASDEFWLEATGRQWEVEELHPVDLRDYLTTSSPR
jgi:hypothetical protein